MGTRRRLLSWRKHPGPTPRTFPVSGQLHKWWGGRPRPRPTPWSAPRWSNPTDSSRTGGTRASRADQGVRPTSLFRNPGDGKSMRHWAGKPACSQDCCHTTALRPNSVSPTARFCRGDIRSSETRLDPLREFWPVRGTPSLGAADNSALRHVRRRRSGSPQFPRLPENRRGPLAWTS